MPTVIPFHRAVVSDPAYVGASTPDGSGEFTVYTQWIETDFDNQITPYAGDSADADEPEERQTVTVEVGGRRLEVVLPGGLGGIAAAGGGGAKKPKRAKKKAGAAASGDSVASPMQGTIVKVVVEEGQEVAEGDVIVVLEAMKMEQPLKAHKAGTVTGLQAEVGATVTNGAVICELKD
jgi:acetyl-CoA/propionyl-CoA carboxylase biotin carboxyl carrier protein